MDQWPIGPGDIQPSHTPGVYPTIDPNRFTFWDSFKFALENMPLIGPAVLAIEGAQNSATVKAAGLYVESTGLPNPDLATLLDFVKTFIKWAAVVLAMLFVVLVLMYSYKIIKEIKS